MTAPDRATLELDTLFPSLRVPAGVEIRCDATIRADVSRPPEPSASPSAETFPRITLDDGATDPTSRGAAGGLSITALLGEGGMGRVYLGHQPSLDRTVAVKVVRPEAAAAGGVEALLGEGRALAYVEHPNVVPIHAIGRDEHGSPALVMKRVDGVPWRELIADAAHPGWATVRTISGGRLAAHVEILMHVCNAVHFAHSRGVVHRDIKPDNVIIGPFGEVYLLDWGIALRVGALPAEVAQQLVGTPAYMAPEMLAGDARRVDARTDVYLLGASLHEVLTGSTRHPCDSIGAALRSALASAPYDYPASVPAGLAAICNRATHLDPARRFPSALDLREALGDHLRHLGSIALGDAASERRRDLDRLLQRLGTGDPASPDEVYRIAAECRFGFGHALREWPENPAARAGLRASVEAVADFDIARGNADAARALLTEIADPAPAVLARLAELEQTIRTRRERSSALEERAHDTDLSVSARSYAAWFAVFAAVLASMAGLALWLRLSAHAPAQLPVLLAGGLFLALAGAVLAGRRRFLGTTANRQVASFVVLVAATIFVSRAFLALHGVGAADALGMDLVMGAVLTAAGGIFLRRWFWGFSALFLAGAVLGAAVPRAAPLTFLLLSLLTTTAGAMLWRRGGR